VTRPVPAPERADRWISRTATVAGLAGIAGAISYSHMRQLAAAHGDTGWHAHAFPLSVVGVEIVASLVLLADRRAGRGSGWLPWAALTIGTAASLAANIATADHGTISRIIAVWPALAPLIAVKLLSGLLEHRTATASEPISTHAGDPDGPPSPLGVSNLPTGPADTPPSRPHRASSRADRPGLPPGRSARHPAGPSPTTSRHLSKLPAPCETNYTATGVHSPATPAPPGSAPLAIPSATPASPRS